MCREVENLVRDYAGQCRREGRMEGRRELISGMLASGKTAEEIAAFTGAALTEVEAVEESMCVKKYLDYNRSQL